MLSLRDLRKLRLEFAKVINMSDIKYEAPRTYTRVEAADIFAAQNSLAISSLMIGLAYYEPEWRWVQDHCIKLSNAKDLQLRYIAALCLSHLARIHGELDLGKVRPVLLSLENDPEQSVRDAADNAIEDISHFLAIDLRKNSQFN